MPEIAMQATPTAVKGTMVGVLDQRCGRSIVTIVDYMYPSLADFLTADHQ